PAANARYASAHFLGQRSSSRSNPAVEVQSSSASWCESRTPRRRCSGEFTRNRPPKDQKAWPPSQGPGSCSRSATWRPALASSAVATRPARPAPTTMTSARSLTAFNKLRPVRDRYHRSTVVGSAAQEVIRADIHGRTRGDARHATATGGRAQAGSRGAKRDRGRVHAVLAGLKGRKGLLPGQGPEQRGG